MKIVIIENNRERINCFLEWLLYMVGYTIVLITASVLFKSIDIDPNLFGLWAFIVAIIIYVLNKTIKPVIVLLTLPITGLTLGLFYPLINVLIIKIVDFVLMDHFETGNVFHLFFVAIMISVMNLLMERNIIEPIVRRYKK